MYYLAPSNNLAEEHSPASLSSSPRQIVMIWLAGTVLLSPVKILSLPFNLELVDFWILAVLPMVWVLFMLRRQTIISWSYTFAMLLILVGSFASTLSAPNSARSFVVISKEIYLFVWFVTLAALFSRLHPDDLRRIMIVWSAAVILHGLLILAQLLSPSIWRMTSGLVGKPSAFTHFRPSGLFMSQDAGDANKAALFQLLGFVPLLLARPPRYIATILAIVLFASMLATGSMGTTIGFAAGLFTLIVAIVVLGKYAALLQKHFVQLFIILPFLAGVFAFALFQNKDYQHHFESILVGRSERSSEGRFGLWLRGRDVFLEHSGFFWGVGPGNFRDVDGNDKQLHNDLIAFVVERGVPTALTLVLFGAIAFRRAVYLLQMHGKYPDRVRLRVVVFPATMAAVLAASLTHQVFHTRELWLVLALQEAMIFRAKSEKGATKRLSFESP